MFNLSTFLERFKDLKDPKEDKGLISQVIFEETGVTLSNENISLSRGVIKLNVGSVVKSAIFMKKEPILIKIQDRLSGTKIENLF